MSHKREAVKAQEPAIEVEAQPQAEVVPLPTSTAQAAVEEVVEAEEPATEYLDQEAWMEGMEEAATQATEQATPQAPLELTLADLQAEFTQTRSRYSYRTYLPGEVYSRNLAARDLLDAIKVIVMDGEFKPADIKDPFLMAVIGLGCKFLAHEAKLDVFSSFGGGFVERIDGTSRGWN